MSAKQKQEDASRNAAFIKAMHGKSATERNAFMSMLNKDSEAHNLITDEYVKRWESGDTLEAREQRKGDYMSLVNNYYDLSTDLYEEGWAQSFHLCNLAPHEPLRQALARHEHYLASQVPLRSSQLVLDVGCGVGGPAREIASFANCKVIGVNNNAYQIQRAQVLTKQAGLEQQVSFVQDDFMSLSKFEDETFDAAYAIEATCHAPSLEGVYGQIFRVLKKGAKVGVYEWVMTDRYNDADPAHREIKLGIERGDGIANMVGRKEALEAMEKVGFEIVHHKDLALRREGDKGRPWFAPLAGEWDWAGSLWDIVGSFRVSRPGRWAMERILQGLETARLAPVGTAQAARELGGGADALVAGGREGLFTPMYLIIAEKPS